MIPIYYLKRLYLILILVEKMKQLPGVNNKDFINIE